MTFQDGLPSKISDNMLQTLLWSCPICNLEDTLSQKTRRLRHDRISCSECQSKWDLIRVVGGPDFNLRLISNNGGFQEKPLAEWYDLMLSKLELTTISHPSWPLDGGVKLDQDESLFLQSAVEMGFTSHDNPEFQQLDLPGDRGGPMGMVPIGPGHLFLTSHQMIFKLADNRTIASLWENLSSVDTLIDRFFTIGFGENSYSFVLKGQSVLKWLTYTRLLIKQYGLENDQPIYQGNL